MGKFDYFYGMQAGQYSFYRIPKALFTEKCFKGLSSEAKILYGLMLDRMGLSMKNRWLDAEDRVYIIFSVEEVMDYIGCSKKTAVKLLADLDAIDLIEKKRLGFGKTNIIYVKNFCSRESEDVKTETEEETASFPGADAPKQEEPAVQERSVKITLLKEREMDEEPISSPETSCQGDNGGDIRSVKNTLQEVSDLHFKRCKNYTSEGVKNTLQEVSKLHPNNTYINNTYSSENKSYLSYPSSYDNIQVDPDWIPDRAEAYKEHIFDNIEYEALCTQYPREEVDEIVGLMLEVLLSERESLCIARGSVPINLVKSRFMKISYPHMQYVLRCLKNNTNKIKNIKQYLLTVLYNAPVTMKHYYQAEVQHDMYGSKGERELQN